MGLPGDDDKRQRPVEDALRRSERRLQSLIEASGAGTFEADLASDGGVRLDDRARSLMGTDREHFADAEQVLSLIHPDDVARVRSALERALDPCRDGRYIVEHRASGGPGEPVRWLEARGQVRFDENGRPARCAGALLDITARKQRELEMLELAKDLARAEAERAELLRKERGARAEAEAANRLKDEFLAAVSHELRTPLTAMLGWLHLLRNNVLTPEKRERALDTIARNAQAQARLIEDLLDVGRIVSGKLTLDNEAADVEYIVAAAVESIRPSADVKHVGLDLQIPEQAPGEPGFTVVGDAKRLQQVVWNLLSNAVKFTPSGGCVWVSLARLEGEVQICVKDNGTGIRPEFLPFVFERFRQAEGGTTRKMAGLGLGLSIVQHLVTAHGGQVTAKSDGLGRGAEFVVRLPASDAVDAQASQQRMTPVPEPLPSAPVLDGMRILVVDDDDDIREYIKALLERSHAQVAEARSAGEALECLRETHPDVLVSNIAMKGVDGHSLIRRVRALSEKDGGTTPAVALTAYARAEDRERSIKAGYQRHVAKPIEPNELLSVLRSLRRGDRRRRAPPS